MDAVEEVTVTGAVPGADGGSGSVQIAFATRSGTNRFDGSVYHYYRAPDLNTNYYFNEVNGLRRTTSSSTSTAAASADRSSFPDSTAAARRSSSSTTSAVSSRRNRPARGRCCATRQ